MNLMQIRLNLVLSFFQQHKDYPDLQQIEKLTNYIANGPSVQAVQQATIVGPNGQAVTVG